MSESKTALGIFADPDDAEFGCAGTLALLKQKGWQIHIATAGNGDCGTAEYSREEIVRIRRAEAIRAADMLDGDYHCLDCNDVFIMYDRETLVRAIALLRKTRPTVVFTASPTDYMVDHEATSRLTQTACFACGMPNIETPGLEPYEVVPYLYYVDAMEKQDILGNKINPSIVIDITKTMDIKEKMLCCHASQRNWLLEHHGMDEYVMSMKRFAGQTGKLINVEHAEGFRPHLGHAFPKDNILKATLGNLVHEI